MKVSLHKAITTAIILFAALFFFASCAESRKYPRNVEFRDGGDPIYTGGDIRMDVNVDGDPRVIYAPEYGSVGYRYGPVFMYYPDGSCDAWFSTTGAGGEWDWITVRHAEKGYDFGDERVCLVPTPNSMDKYSCCDPGIIYFNGYYYLGYTSTVTDLHGGTNNNVFVARSRRAEGPYEKWNGEGWGGDPAPVIYYDEDYRYYGAGEPSFVILGDTLYIYYTWICGHGSYLGVATADLSDNWPATVTVHEDKLMQKESDSFDVVYVEETGRFLAFATVDRFSKNSGVIVYESSDGFDFYENEVLRKDLYAYCHNMGVARRSDGHVRLSDNIVIGYAFGDGGDDSWGKWAAALQPVRLEVSDVDSIKKDGEDVLSTRCVDFYAEPAVDLKPINICAIPRFAEMYCNSGGFEPALYWYDGNLGMHEISDLKKVKMSGYDKSLISVKNGRINFLGKAGETTVTLTYKGFTETIIVCLREVGEPINDEYRRTVKSAELVNDEFVISKEDVHRRQIRFRVVFTDNSRCEIYGEPAVSKRFPADFRSQDGTVAVCDKNGFIIPVNTGETYIEASVGDFTGLVRVVVTE